MSRLRLPHRDRWVATKRRSGRLSPPPMTLFGLGDRWRLADLASPVELFQDDTASDLTVRRLQKFGDLGPVDVRLLKSKGQPATVPVMGRRSEPRVFS